MVGKVLLRPGEIVEYYRSLPALARKALAAPMVLTIPFEDHLGDDFDDFCKNMKLVAEPEED